MRTAFLLLLPLLLSACDSNPATPTPAVNMFAPTSMRIHPIFTQLMDRNHAGNPEAIEVHLEFQDQFGDPTKASGRVLFELFDFRKDSPDPRGRRVGGPWVGALDSLDDQHARWNTTLRTYRFELNDSALRSDKSYVLSVIFELTGGGRFFDRIVIKGVELPTKKTRHSSTQFFDEPSRPSTPPATAP